MLFAYFASRSPSLQSLLGPSGSRQVHVTIKRETGMFASVDGRWPHEAPCAWPSWAPGQGKVENLALVAMRRPGEAVSARAK